MKIPKIVIDLIKKEISSLDDSREERQELREWLGSLEKPYTHRSGETETPTVIGHYWIEINPTSAGVEPAFWHPMGGWSTRYGNMPVPSKPFRIWGPIIYPERN